MRKIIVAFVLGCVLVLTGCSKTVPIQVKPMIVQESLLEVCTADTPLPKNFVLDPKGEKQYNGKEVLNLLVEWQRVYDECASSKDALVGAIRDVQSRTEIKIQR